jgi:hypothetical protein
MDKQKLTIKFEHQYGAEEVSFERIDILDEELFWSWFINIWPALGLSFVKEGIENDQ